MIDLLLIFLKLEDSDWIKETDRTVQYKTAVDTSVLKTTDKHHYPSIDSLPSLEEFFRAFILFDLISNEARFIL
jgi:hypothetical protein